MTNSQFRPPEAFQIVAKMSETDGWESNDLKEGREGLGSLRFLFAFAASPACRMRLIPVLVFFVWVCGFSLPLDSSSARASVPSATVLDLSGHAVDPFAMGEAKVLVFLFISVECPISNSYAPEFRRMETEFDAKKVLVRLVYPNADESADAIKKHLKEFNLGPAAVAWRDPRHELVKAADVSVTPEAAVFVTGSGFVYRGRIDNRYQDFGLARPEATERDLRNALASVLAGKPVARRTTTAIGCYIPKLK